MSKPQPDTAKGTSVSSAVRITINGQVFELTKADAEKLRDQISDAVGDKPYTIEQYRQRMAERAQFGGMLLAPPPSRTPYDDQFYRGPGTPIPSRHEITCAIASGGIRESQFNQSAQ